MLEVSSLDIWSLKRQTLDKLFWDLKISLNIQKFKTPFRNFCNLFALARNLLLRRIYNVFFFSIVGQPRPKSNFRLPTIAKRCSGGGVDCMCFLFYHTDDFQKHFQAIIHKIFWVFVSTKDVFQLTQLIIEKCPVRANFKASLR